MKYRKKPVVIEAKKLLTALKKWANAVSPEAAFQRAHWF